MAKQRAPKLGERGARLWRETTAAAVLGPAQLVLLEEACRIADRLDRLDQLLSGDVDAWARVAANEAGDELRLVIDSALAEGRQQAVALRQIVTELRQSTAKAGASALVGAGVSDLTARIAARRGETSS